MSASPEVERTAATDFTRFVTHCSARVVHMWQARMRVLLGSRSSPDNRLRTGVKYACASARSPAGPRRGASRTVTQRRCVAIAITPHDRLPIRCALGSLTTSPTSRSSAPSCTNSGALDQTTLPRRSPRAPCRTPGLLNGQENCGARMGYPRMVNPASKRRAPYSS